MTKKDFYGRTTTYIPSEGAEPITEVWPAEENVRDTVYTIKPQMDYFEFAKLLRDTWHVTEIKFQ